MIWRKSVDKAYLASHAEDEHRDVVSPADELVGDDGADIARAAGDEQPHGDRSWQGRF